MLRISHKRQKIIGLLFPNKTGSPYYKPLIIIILLFILSRGFYYTIGIRFDAFEGEHLLHFISPELLKNNLLQSVFYLHIQPKLYRVIYL